MSVWKGIVITVFSLKKDDSSPFSLLYGLPRSSVWSLWVLIEFIWRNFRLCYHCRPSYFGCIAALTFSWENLVFWRCFSRKFKSVCGSERPARRNVYIFRKVWTFCFPKPHFKFTAHGHWSFTGEHTQAHLVSYFIQLNTQSFVQ